MRDFGSCSRAPAWSTRLYTSRRVGYASAVRFVAGRTPLTVVISEDSPDTPDAVLLRDDLAAHLASFCPSESRHGFSVEKLLRDGVRFFVARDDGRPAGCGGILIVEREYAEIKRMYVRPAFRGRGLGRLMLER